MHLLSFDEAQAAIFSKVLEQRGRTPVVATLATQARAYGMALAVLVQNPATKLITEMLSNSANLVCFHIGGTEIKGMIDCMGLSMEQAGYLAHLQPAECLFKTSLGYTEPLQIQINNIDTTPPSDSEIKELMKGEWRRLLDLVVPVEEKTEIKADEKLEGAKNTEKSKPASDKNVKNESELSANDVQFLMDCQLRPFEVTESRYKGTTLARNSAVKAKTKLCRLNYLEPVSLKRGGRGKPSQLLRMTEKAIQFLGITQDKGRGGSEHQFYQKLIVHLAKQNGLRAKMEDMQTDVSIVKDSFQVAVEVIIACDSNILHHIERNFRNGFSEMWIAVKDKVSRKKVNAQLTEMVFEQQNVKVILLEEILIHIKEMSEEIQ